MRRVQILIAMIAAFLIVAPAALAQVKPPQAPVPNVAGKTLSAAQQALVSAGFNALVTQENVTDPGKNNIVLKQQIPPGTTLSKGSNVPVVVGKYTAPAQQPVPSVVGMPLDKAQATLAQAKLNAQVTMQPVPEPQRNNVVLAQNVPAGKTLSPGSMVPVVVGKYTAPAQQPVPSVVGMPLDKAQATLAQAKLNAQVTMQPVPEPQRNNVVLAQNVPAGKTLSPGSMVPVVVGKYTAPAQQPVPSVVGMPLDKAQATLAQAKLNAQVTMQPVRRAAAQQRRPGTKRPRREDPVARFDGARRRGQVHGARPAARAQRRRDAPRQGPGRPCEDKAQRRRHDGKGDRQKQKQYRIEAANRTRLLAGAGCPGAPDRRTVPGNGPRALRRGDDIRHRPRPL